MSELLKQKLDELGYPSVEFSPHSLRAGGATAAGVPDRIFKRYGRWKSENVKDGYVKDSLEKRLLFRPMTCMCIYSWTDLYVCILTFSTTLCYSTVLKIDKVGSRTT